MILKKLNAIHLGRKEIKVNTTLLYSIKLIGCEVEGQNWCELSKIFVDMGLVDV